MLRLNALGSRRLLESVKEDARRPTEASATSTRGIFFGGCPKEESDRASAAAPPTQPSTTQRLQPRRYSWSEESVKMELAYTDTRI